MCKSNRFNDLQNAMLDKARELKLPENIQTSISYAICAGDLWYIVQLADDKQLRDWFFTLSNK